jgi:CDP-glucose 4,6-dehydratase
MKIEDLKKTYADKKIFLTGHTGFKGAWLLKILQMCGATVKGYALSPKTDDDLYNIIRGEEICESIIADLRDKDRLKKEILDFAPDFVFHLAAQPLVRLSYDIPAETFEVNAIGTAYLLDAVRQLTKPCVIVLITTDKVYHNNEWIYPYRENDRLGGYDPYSASKACAELVIDSYRNSFFNINKYAQHQKAIAIGRAGNVIGGGDWSQDRLVPDIAKALGNDQEIVVRNPFSVRPWQHVLEPLAGYLQLGIKLQEEPVKYAQPYNFGPYADDALQVREMVELAIGKWGHGSYEILSLSSQPHEAGLLKLDISKAISELQWSPKLNASIAIEYSIEWYKTFFKNKNEVEAFTEQQIMKFFDK